MGLGVVSGQLLSPIEIGNEPYENVELELQQGTIRGRRYEVRILFRVYQNFRTSRKSLLETFH